MLMYSQLEPEISCVDYDICTNDQFVIVTIQSRDDMLSVIISLDTGNAIIEAK